MRKRKSLLIIASIFLTLAFVAGTYYANPQPFVSRYYSCIDIASVNGSPLIYKDQDVRVTGKVVEDHGPLGLPMYRIADKSGDIWVAISSKTEKLPSIGSIIVLKGKVEEVDLLGKRIGIVMDEEKRLYTRGK